MLGELLREKILSGFFLAAGKMRSGRSSIHGTIIRVGSWQCESHLEEVAVLIASLVVFGQGLRGIVAS